MKPGAMLNSFQPGAADLAPGQAELIERRARLLGPAYRLFYDRPLQVTRGEGVWLYDQDGVPHLDAYNNVASVGHAHPHVAGAIARQAARLATHTRYLDDGILDYAERLLATFPPDLGHVMFTCSGSEANDLAVRVAEAATGGTGIVVTETAYHGVTQGVAAFSPSLGPGVPLAPHVRTVPAPNPWLSGDVAGDLTRAVEGAIVDLRRHGIRPALLIADALFTSDGVMTEPCLAGAVAAMRDAGGLYLADEVQSGFARSGEAFWGFERHGLVPDLVTMGKPMGNGYPVAALVARPDVLEPFGRAARYFNTFGGNGVAIAAAGAVLDVIEGEGLQANALVTGAALARAIRGLGHPSLVQVRQAGLMIGVEVELDGAPDGALASRIVQGMRERRVLISASGKHGNILKIRPPLVFGAEHVAIFADALAQTLQDL